MGDNDGSPCCPSCDAVGTPPGAVATRGLSGVCGAVLASRGGCLPGDRRGGAGTFVSLPRAAEAGLFSGVSGDKSGCCVVYTRMINKKPSVGPAPRAMLRLDLDEDGRSMHVKPRAGWRAQANRRLGVREHRIPAELARETCELVGPARRRQTQGAQAGSARTTRRSAARRSRKLPGPRQFIRSAHIL